MNTCNAPGGLAYCTWCKCNISTNHKPALVAHGKTKKHEKAKQDIPEIPNSNQRSLGEFGITRNADPLKTAEIKLATSIACHASLKSIDHFGEVVKTFGKGSIWEDLMKIVKNVVAESLKEDLKKALKGSKYALLIDESTDVSTT